MSKGLFDRLQDELDAREQSLGLKMSDLLTLPEPINGLLNWMFREDQVSIADVMTSMEMDEPAALALLDQAKSQGFVREIELPKGRFYRVRLAPRRESSLSAGLWQLLEERCADREEEQP